MGQRGESLPSALIALHLLHADLPTSPKQSKRRRQPIFASLIGGKTRATDISYVQSHQNACPPSSSQAECKFPGPSLLTLNCSDGRRLSHLPMARRHLTYLLSCCSNALRPSGKTERSKMSDVSCHASRTVTKVCGLLVCCASFAKHYTGTVTMQPTSCQTAHRHLTSGYVQNVHNFISHAPSFLFTSSSCRL